MKEYILRGNEADVDKVVRENRIRVARGLIEFVPCDEDPSEDFIDDDVNGIPNAEDINHEDDSFDDGEENALSPEVEKIILEPLKSEESAAKDTAVSDSKEAVVADDKTATAAEEKKPKGKKPKSE